MDACAELTLHVARFLQMPVDPPCSAARWTFVPEFRRATWPEASDLLARAPKPLLVAPLMDPGFLGTWGLNALRDEYLARTQHALNNQLSAFEHSVGGLQLHDTDNILFETAADQISVIVADARRWMREYVITGGWTLGEGPDATHPARLLILRTFDRTWSPGRVCTPRPPA